MYDSRIIGEAGYGRLHNIENTVGWSQIQAKYGVKKKFKSVADMIDAIYLQSR